MNEHRSLKSLFDLTDKSVIVTGAAGFLGRHFCAGLAEAGARVAVVDLEEDAVRAQAEALAADYQVLAIGRACDVSSPQDVADLVSDVSRELGPVDVLVNNAASQAGGQAAFYAPIEDYPLEIWRTVMEVNLDGMFVCAQAVGRHMIAGGRGGSIVQLSSIYGILGPDSRIYDGVTFQGREINTPPVYAASKAGVLGLTRHLATQWAKHGIRVNSLVPGGVARGGDAGFERNYGARVPLGRMAEPDEIVAALIFLAADASTYVTGQSLVVDGGLSAW